MSIENNEMSEDDDIKIGMLPGTPIIPVKEKDYIESFIQETGLTHKEISESIELSKVTPVLNPFTNNKVKKSLNEIGNDIITHCKVKKPLNEIGNNNIRHSKVNNINVLSKVTPALNPFTPDAWQIIVKVIEHISKGDTNTCEIYMGVLKGSFPNEFKVLQQIVYGSKNYDITKVQQ